MYEVRRLRQKKGWNQNELAFHADLAPSVISQIETGKREPSASTLRKLAEALDVDIPDLFGREEAPKVQAPTLQLEEEQRGASQERLSAYLEIFKRYMAQRAAAWEHQANKENSLFFSDWEISADYASEVSQEVFALAVLSGEELVPAIYQAFTPEDAFREHTELANAVESMAQAGDKSRVRHAALLERAMQEEDIDNAALQKARGKEEQIAEERRAAFKLLDGRQSA